MSTVDLRFSAHNIMNMLRKTHMNKNKGFIQIVIILVLLLIILSLLGVSLSSLFSNPILAENFGFVKTWALWLWNNYLKAPAYQLIKIFGNLIWQPFMDVMGGLMNNINPFDYIKPPEQPGQ